MEPGISVAQALWKHLFRPPESARLKPGNAKNHEQLQIACDFLFMMFEMSTRPTGTVFRDATGIISIYNEKGSALVLRKYAVPRRSLLPKQLSEIASSNGTMCHSSCTHSTCALHRSYTVTGT